MRSDAIPTLPREAEFHEKEIDMKKLNLSRVAIGAGLALLLTPVVVFAQEVAPDAAEAAGEAAEAAEAAGAGAQDLDFVFNTLLFLIGGFLVMFMAAGFCMLEAGMVRARNASMQCLKNISLYSVAGLMYFLIGYNLMYTDVGSFFGSPGPILFPDPATESGDYSVASDWFFQMVFCAAVASIVSGTVAERVRLWPFLIFTAALTGIIYPITGSWTWGEGWLDQAGFSDFAGSTIVHSIGGWAALSGALVLGARAGKYGPDGQVNALPGSSMPLATLGTFILWLGWFGFNGASQLAMGTIEDIASVAQIFANTNIAAASGVVAAIVLCQVLYGKVDLTLALNGALGGLVSITAEPLTPNLFMAALIGGVGGGIIVLSVPLLDKLRIDDVVGAVPVHLFCGIWGTLAVPLTNSDANFGTQILGIVAMGAFAFIATGIVWLILKATIGARVSEEDERLGLDRVEVGVEAYPEFGEGSQRYGA